MFTSTYEMALWNTFRFVRLNQEHATLVFVLHSHVEFYFTYKSRKLSFDLTDLMDIDETHAKDTHSCRMALKPPTGCDPATPLVLTIGFESALAYDRFIDLLVRSQVFYYHNHKIKPHGLSGWFGNLGRHPTNQNTGHHHAHHNELKLMPARMQQLRNYLHLLTDWKDTNSV